VGDLADQPEVVTIGADDTVEEAINTMERHKVRQLPVIDGHTVIGMLSQGDVARSQPAGPVGQLLAALST
jgi:CBS domain-containing protein